jgi:VanZ family protein
MAKLSQGTYRAVFAVYIIVILALSAYPIPDSVNTGNDKVNHFLAFLIFPAMAILAFREISPAKRFLLGLAFGLLIEFIQLFVPGRSAELLDVGADCLGLIAGEVLLRLQGGLRER